jgi:hypothetical protein
MKINTKNTPKVQAVLDKFQKPYRARLMRVAQIDSAIKAAETRLHDLSIPKKYWNGSTISIKAGAVPNSYGYPATATVATIKRFPTGWFLTELSRGDAPRWDAPLRRLALSHTALKGIPDTYKI